MDLLSGLLESIGTIRCLPTDAVNDDGDDNEKT